MRVINLNTKNRIISGRMIYQRSLHTTVVRVAEIFRPAIIENANGIVVVHNHPSGEADPSPEDVALTREIVHAGRLLDVEILDHLVIGRGERGFVSLKERGLGFGGQVNGVED
jgi:DNA repair protein RadC